MATWVGQVKADTNDKAAVSHPDLISRVSWTHGTHEGGRHAIDLGHSTTRPTTAHNISRSLALAGTAQSQAFKAIAKHDPPHPRVKGGGLRKPYAMRGDWSGENGSEHGPAGKDPVEDRTRKLIGHEQPHMPGNLRLCQSSRRVPGIVLQITTEP